MADLNQIYAVLERTTAAMERDAAEQEIADADMNHVLQWMAGIRPYHRSQDAATAKILAP